MVIVKTVDKAGWVAIQAGFEAIKKQRGRVTATPLSHSDSRTRTYDPRINSPLLYQLSYAGVLCVSGGGN